MRLAGPIDYAGGCDKITSRNVIASCCTFSIVGIGSWYKSFELGEES